MEFMQGMNVSHRIRREFARGDGGFVSNMQQVAISYKLLMHCNSLRARQNFLHK
ncbi:hypothetical protein [Rugamonas aquatica]|uniref:hypothetical protein n=1 Tax=Rugamonas aquatica TaxID=2743357 RepID=UPI001581C4FC|nr:hypothetical protein [Rugamonas aquatica]